MTEEQIVQEVLSNLKIENPCPMLLGRMRGLKETTKTAPKKEL